MFVRHGLDQITHYEYRDDGVYVFMPEFRADVAGFSVSIVLTRVRDMRIADPGLRFGFTALPQWGLIPHEERIRSPAADRIRGTPPTHDAREYFDSLGNR